MDPQIGAMAVLRQIMALDPSARFKSAPARPKAKPAPPVPGQSPRADDSEETVKPLGKSKTLWGGILQGISAAVASIAAFIQGMPPWLVLILIAAVLIGLFMVIKGRIDVQAIIKHLSADEEAA
jgi:hypothetical protein